MSQDCFPKGPVMGDEIRGLYTELALHPERNFGWGRGKENARALGYDHDWLTRLPSAVWESSAAVGNPFAIGPVQPGETVIDLGCGAGADACVAALLVGPSGRVIGVDMTPAMVEKAHANVALAGFFNIEIVAADIADLPCPDACADVVISNGAINLSQRKACVLQETLRILKPGGRLYVADMVRESGERASSGEPEEPKGSWANCVTGTLTALCFQQMLLSAGFERVECLGVTAYRTSKETVGAMFRATRPAR